MNGTETKVCFVVRCTGQYTVSDDPERNSVVTFSGPWGDENPHIFVKLIDQPAFRWQNGRVYSFDVDLEPEG